MSEEAPQLPPSTDNGFFAECRQARRILVLDLGFLGDTIHLLPALWRLRMALPDAALHVVVASHVTSLMKLTPWVDGVIGYRRFPTSDPLWKNVSWIRRLRAMPWDALINLNGSDRSSFLSLMSGAPCRLGREPERCRPWWPYLFTHIVRQPYGTQPVYLQRCACLDAAGFPPAPARFHIQPPQEESRRVAALLGAERPYVHVSPCATQDGKELPLPLLARCLNALRRAHPSLELVLSCAPNEREQGKMADLLGRLEERPWHVFDGTLNLVELAILMRGARAHMGGDSGALHVALMAGVPTLSWFRDYPGKVEWLPVGDGHVHLTGEASPQGLQGIDEEAWLAACNRLPLYRAEGAAGCVSSPH